MDIDKIIRYVIDNPEAGDALTSKMKTTLRPWETYSNLGYPFPRSMGRRNLLGEWVAFGHKTQSHREEGDKSLQDQGFTLLEE